MKTNTAITLTWIIMILVAATAAMAMQPYIISNELADVDTTHIINGTWMASDMGWSGIDSPTIDEGSHYDCDSTFITSWYVIGARSEPMITEVAFVDTRSMPTKEVLALNNFDTWTEFEQELLVEMMAETANPSYNHQAFIKLLDNATVRVMETYIDLLENSGVV